MVCRPKHLIDADQVLLKYRYALELIVTEQISGGCSGISLPLLLRQVLGKQLASMQ